MQIEARATFFDASDLETEAPTAWRFSLSGHAVQSVGVITQQTRGALFAGDPRRFVSGHLRLSAMPGADRLKLGGDAFAPYNGTPKTLIKTIAFADATAACASFTSG